MNDRHVYDFGERLRYSEGFAQDMKTILRQEFPAYTAIRKASKAEDMEGVDYWVVYSCGKIAIDAKIREEDWKGKGKDDLALESWSVIDKKVGWTRDSTKRTDYVAWFWQDTGRYFIVPFRPLCAIFTQYWQQWREWFKVAQQTSGEWESECIFVPRKLIVQKLLQFRDDYVQQADRTWRRTTAPPEAGSEIERLQLNWKQVIDQAPPDTRRTPAAAILRGAGTKPVAIEGDTVVLAFKHNYHREQIEKMENRQVAEKIMGNFLGHPCHVRCKLEDDRLLKAALKMGAQIIDKEPK